MATLPLTAFGEPNERLESNIPVLQNEPCAPDSPVLLEQGVDEWRRLRFHGVLAPHAALRSQIVPGDPDQATAPTADVGDPPSASTRTRLSWAQLLKRVFAIDMASCPYCGGPLPIIAAIEDLAVIAKILTHLGLPTRAPPRSPARTGKFLQTA